MIQKGKVTFQPKSGDHGFTVTSKAQISVAEATVDRTLPGLSIRWQGADSKEHKYNMAIIMFMAKVPRGPLLTAASPFQAEGNAGDRTNHLNRIVLDLIDKSLN